jgi:two-component system LytT family response regulator
MIKAVIIDDIEQARTTFKKDLEEYAKDVQVIGEAGGVVEGAKLLKNVKPDILFLDIQMQDGSGFDLLDLLNEIPFKIIFITASDAHAIKAFRYAAIDYLLKPIDPDELVRSINRFREQRVDEHKKYELLSETLKNSGKKTERLALHSQNKIDLVNISDIIRCESEVNYTVFFLTGGRQIVVSKTLKEYEEILSSHNFYRVHQSHLVNTKYIKEFVKTDDELIMTEGRSIPVSSRKRPEVVQMLDNL